MSDEIWKRDEIDSPCVKICIINENNGLCAGCFRTREEIATWSRMTADDRKNIIDVLDERQKQNKPRRLNQLAQLSFFFI